MNNKKLTLALALTLGFVSPTAPILAANISTTVLASSLNNPRGITAIATFPLRAVPNSPNPMEAVPTGMAIGPDNQLYIGGQGQILKITSTPEMTSAIALGITGLFSLRLRSRKS